MASKVPKSLIRQKANGQTIRLDMDKWGTRAFLQSEEVGDIVEMSAHDILLPIVKALSGRKAEYAVGRYMGRDRQRVHVGTANIEGMLAEAQDRALIRALYMVTTGKKPK